MPAPSDYIARGHVREPHVNGVASPPLTVDAATVDAFTNALARIGWGSGNLLEGTSYPLTRLSRNYILMQSLYRTNWIARRVIDAVPEDMMKNWVTLNGQVDPAEIDDFQRAVARTKTRENILEGLQWGRLYGGAGAVMILKGHEDILDEPLDLDDVAPQSYRGVLVFDRWSGISPGVELISDLESPDFGLPAYYQITLDDGAAFRVHASRVLRFTGRKLPNWERQAEQGWGISEFELIYDELRKRDNTSWNIASLIFRANIFALKMKDLSQMLSTGNAAFQQRVWNALEAQNRLMSNQGLMLLPEDGGLESHQYAFTGINDVYQSFMMDICGACEIPMTRLFGRTITGLGQSNEGDERIYYDAIGQKQNRELRPQLEKLFQVVAMSTWGQIPDDLDFSFPPVRNPSDKERSELGKELTDSVLAAFNAGVIGRKTTLQELRQNADATGLFSNITDEMIEAAEEDPQQAGEFGLSGGNPFGENGEDEPEPETGKKKLKTSDEEWSEAEHPREPAGGSSGGQFASAGGGGSASEGEGGEFSEGDPSRPRGGSTAAPTWKEMRQQTNNEIALHESEITSIEERLRRLERLRPEGWERQAKSMRADIARRRETLATLNKHANLFSGPAAKGKLAAATRVGKSDTSQRMHRAIVAGMCQQFPEVAAHLEKSGYIQKLSIGEELYDQSARFPDADGVALWEGHVYIRRIGGVKSPEDQRPLWEHHRVQDFQSDPAQAALALFLHEAAHQYHNNDPGLWSPRDENGRRKVSPELDSLFQNALANNRAITGRAKLNAQEYFVESFSAALMHPAELDKRDPEMGKFIKKWLAKQGIGKP
jgi:phage-related protein (TIGR01555 family)